MTMMQPEILFQQPFQSYQNMFSYHDNTEFPDFQMNSIFPNNFADEFSAFSDQMLVPPFLEDFENSIVELDPSESFVRGLLNECESDQKSSAQMSMNQVDLWSPTPSLVSSENSTVTQSLVFPGEDVRTDKKLGLHHLLVAYAEAVEKKQKDLEEVIVKCIHGKVNPLGELLERLAFSLFRNSEEKFYHGDYLREESNKNFETALKVVYEWFLYGRVAHFSANSAILKAMPDDAKIIHIIDFDVGEGVQWPPLIEALGRKHKQFRLTLIKFEEDFGKNRWRFDEMKRSLRDCARSFSLNLQVDEMSFEELESEMKRKKKSGGRKEWMAFNCMFRLPHMQGRLTRAQALEFLGSAKRLLADPEANSRGVIVFGDGEARESSRTCSGYRSFFERQITHYKALLESMEWSFPAHLAEARIAMETLFVAPSVCSSSWLDEFEQTRGVCDLTGEIGLEGLRISNENLSQAKQLVNEGKNWYSVLIDGENENEMVLKWRATPLIRISTWI